jgi:hypothetical protein
MKQLATKPLNFRGVEYASTAAAAAAHGVQRAAVSYRMRHKGETAEQALNVLTSSGIAAAKSRKGRVRVGAITFASIEKASAYYGVSHEAVAARMRQIKGLSAAAAIEWAVFGEGRAS